jgi:hypothetical protein
MEKRQLHIILGQKMQARGLYMEALRHKRRETERNVELEQPSDGAERPGGRPIYWNRTSAHLSFALTAHVTSTRAGTKCNGKCYKTKVYQEKYKVNFSCFIMVYIYNVYPN